MAKTLKKAHHRSKVAAIANEINSIIGAPVLRLGNDEAFTIIRIPSGSLVIDRITGGGFALGRHIEIYGDESSTKSYVVYKTMALSQQRGNTCALIDPEHNFDPKWFEHLGGRPEELIMAWPTIAEQAVEAMMLLMQRGDIEIIGVDSVAALSTKEEIRKAPNAETDVRIASVARFMSTNLRRLTTVNDRTLVLWINQNRTNITTGPFYGKPTTQPGGRALKFYDTARIELKRGEGIKKKKKSASTKAKLVDKNVSVGYWVVARAHKNKAGREGMEGAFVFDTVGGQIDPISEIMYLGMEDGIIVRKGNTFEYEDYNGDMVSGQRASFESFIREDADLFQELEEQIQDQSLALALPQNGDGSYDSNDIEEDEEQ